MTHETIKEEVHIDELVQEYQIEQDEVERKADRNYHIHNISLEHLKASYVPVEKLSKVKSAEVLDEMLASNDRYGLLEIVENEHLFMALKELKEIDLMILDLRYKQNLLLKEISQVLEKDLSTISRHINSSLKRIKENIENKK